MIKSVHLSNLLNIQQVRNENLKLPKPISILKSVGDYNILFCSGQSRMFIIDKKEMDKIKTFNLTFPKKHPFRHLFLSLTSGCNSECSYCYAKGGEFSLNLNFDFIKKSIDFIKSHKEDKETTSILFTGGEPTLRFDLLRKTVEYADSILGKTRYTMWSNGIFSNRATEWILENIYELQISCDGPSKIQNLQRPLKGNKASSPFVENNIRLLIDKKAPLFIRTTITAHSVDKQLEIIEYFHSLGVKIVYFEPLHESGRSLRYKDFSPIAKSPEISTFVSNFLKAQELAYDYEIKLSSVFFPERVFDTFCGASSGENVCLTPDMYISSCVEAFYGKEGPKEFIYGKYDKNRIVLFRKVLEKLKERYPKNIPECRNCIIKWNCAGDCHIKTLQLTGDMFKPFKPRCKSKISLLNGSINYVVNKHITKIKPYLEKKDNKLFFSTVFNKYEINNKNFIRLNKNNSSEILSFIRRFKVIPRFIFIDISIPWTDIDRNVIYEIKKICRKQKILLKWLRFLPYCISREEFSCKNCLSMFTVYNNSIIFCNGKKGKNIKKYLTREEIFMDFSKNSRKTLCKNFENCIYYLRNNCDGFSCSEGIKYI